MKTLSVYITTYSNLCLLASAVLSGLAISGTARAEGCATPAPAEQAVYWGDLHVHTMYSFDAFIFGTTSSPDDAYEFAKGGTVVHPAGFDMTLDRPLDFYGVSDHAFYIGVLREMANPESEISKHEIAAGMTTLGDAADRGRKFYEMPS